jgi:phytoene synthase
MPTVSESYAHCRRVARTRARNFYYSFLLLPREQKDAMCAIYAFMRYADDISDEPDPPLEARRKALSAWRGALEGALKGNYNSDPILPAFHDAVSRYAIPEQYFFDLMDGVNSDLHPRRFETFDDVYRYCYQVASVVGMTTVHVFGFESPEALPLAEKCGVAFQLTNILRDIAEDADAGRVYLPEDDLARFDLSPRDLIERRHGDRFRALMEFEWQRANRYYDDAAPLLGLIRPGSRAAMWTLITIYRRILRRIRAIGFDVYDQRPSLSDLEKSWILLRALKLRLLGGAPPFPA